MASSPTSHTTRSCKAEVRGPMAAPSPLHVYSLKQQTWRKRNDAADRVGNGGELYMARYLLLRLADAIPTILLVLTLVFIAMRILPGDPAIAALGDMATADQLALFREKMGLNVPLWHQYINFVIGV